jgi:PAS domain-containing protein
MEFRFVQKVEVHMEEINKLCFLGYKQLTTLARKVIDELPYTDTEIHLIDCIVETLPRPVDDALGKGYEIFIAGSGNAAAFVRYSHAHLCEITIRDIDYLIAIKKALALGPRVAIVTYRFSRSLNIGLLSELSGAQVGHIVYEDPEELYYAIRNSDYDVIIGASQSNEYAEALGRKSVLVYAGEDTIRRTINRARNLAIELRKEQRYNEIHRAIVSNVPMGVIVSDETGRISLINPMAQSYVGVPATLARGRLLSEVAPNLSPRPLLESAANQTDAYRILNGVRFRCIQSRLQLKDNDIGVLTTLHIDNRRQKRTPAVPGAGTPPPCRPRWPWAASMPL